MRTIGAKMADTSELKHMVMSFRVSELQVLLGYAGRNKTGRKTELLQRALQLVQKGTSVPIQIKIRELYKRKAPGRDGDLPGAGMTCNYNLLYPGHGSGANVSNNATEARKGYDSPVKAETTARYRGPMDFTSRMPPDAPGIGLPVHPDVRFKLLPFYDCITELMKPTSLSPRGSSKFQETHFNFHLTPQQAQDIAMSRDFRPGVKFEYTTQIQLRFCLLETTCEQDDNFPSSICVRVNGKMAPLPNPIPTTKPGVEPKRPGRPVDITPLCRLSPTMPNQIEVSWATDFNRGYCLAIYLVKKLSSDTLLSRLKQFGSRHADHTRALIKEKLSHDPDSEIATTSLRVSLLCPLGKMRMQIPIRASTCTHLQCFDASTYLMMNEKKPTWICPVCDKPSVFHKLFIDGLFVEILRQAVDVNDIQFTEDGSWSRLKAHKELHIISSPAPKASASVNLIGSESPTKKPKLDVIDLTLSSSDEEDDDRTVVATPQPSSCYATSPGCVSPPVISLDSPTPVPSISSADSPLVSSPCSNSSSSSSSSSNSSSPAGRSSPGSPASAAQQLSAPHTPIDSSPSPDSPAPTSVRSSSAHSTTQSPTPPILQPQPQPSPKQSPVRVRMSPVTPPATNTPSFPPFQPFPPAPVPPMNYPYPSMSNFDPTLDREIDEFLQGIVWDQYFR